MIVAADTNLLLRIVLGDDAEQMRCAQSCMEQAERIIVTNVVFCELAWVMRKVHRRSTQDIVAAISAIASRDKVSCSTGTVDAGLSALAAGADFSDGVIAFEGATQGGTFVSFDRKAVEVMTGLGIEAMVPGV